MNVTDEKSLEIEIYTTTLNPENNRFCILCVQ